MTLISGSELANLVNEQINTASVWKTQVAVTTLNETVFVSQSVISLQSRQT